MFLAFDTEFLCNILKKFTNQAYICFKDKILRCYGLEQMVVPKLNHSFSFHLILPINSFIILPMNSYQSIVLQNKLMDCFLYDRDLRHERIKSLTLTTAKLTLKNRDQIRKTALHLNSAFGFTQLVEFVVIVLKTFYLIYLICNLICKFSLADVYVQP